MALSVTHPFVSGIAEGADPTLVGPNEWNAAHTLTGSASVAQGGTGIASGTSGGIPYFSSISTIASSALLTANAWVLGGGAGVAPFAASGVSWDNTNLALTLTGATVTTSNPILNLTQTWNAGGVTFTGIKLNVTNTASASASLLMDLQVGSSSVHSVDVGGNITVPNNTFLQNATHSVGLEIFSNELNLFGSSGALLLLGSGGFTSIVQTPNTGVYGWTSGNVFATIDTAISRSAAGVIAFGNGTQGDASGVFVAKTKAGAPTTSDVPSGDWILIRDTTNATTKIYYNNAGTLQSVTLT